MVVDQATLQQAVDNAVKAKLDTNDIYKFVSEWKKRGVHLRINFPNRSPNRNNINVYNGGGQGRLLNQQRELHNVK